MSTIVTMELGVAVVSIFNPGSLWNLIKEMQLYKFLNNTKHSSKTTDSLR